MTTTALALKGVKHYWRTNLATMAGLAIAVAVLAGAVAVGDSVRASLREIALRRLGNTHHALVSNNFFRESLTPDCPLIALEAAVTHDDSGRRASKVALYGVDQRFFEFHGRAVDAPRGAEVLVSPALAAELVAKPGDSLLLRMPRASAIPTESLHGQKDDPGRTIRTRLRDEIAPAAMGEFSLNPQQGPVRAVFVSLDRLQRDLDLDGRVNTALLRSVPDLRAHYRLEDIGLRVRGRMLEHEAMIFSDDLVKQSLEAIGGGEPVFTYLANVIRANGREIPYSLVAAVDSPDLPSDNSMVLNEWAARELQAKPGDQISIEYFLWDPSGRLVTQGAKFTVSAIAPVAPEDRELAPEYPGISGAENISDWDPPFPLDLKLIRPADEDYWHKYRATPKAYIRLGAGQKLWRTRYGAVTSIRLPEGFDPERLRASLDPRVHGLTIVDVRADALAASQGATDFGEYFLYFSFFLLVSALLLAGLFFRFGLEQRAAEIATLRALGWSVAQVRRLHLTEALLIGVAGSAIGLIGAAAYAGLIMTALRTWWVDAVGTRELALHLTPVSLLIGFAGGLIMAPLAVWGALRRIGRTTPRHFPHLRNTRLGIYAGIAAALGVALLFIGGAAGFFGSGALLLIAALLLVRRFLASSSGHVSTVGLLGYRYASNRPGRSVLCIALIASATFLIVSIDSFRRTGTSEDPGWAYVAESAIPVYHDPNNQDGRAALNLPGNLQAKWLAFRLRPGDDASCLNLYQPRNPRVLGVPESYLKLPPQSDGTISTAVDANTLQYALHKKLGDVIEVGGKHLRVTTVLNDSLFQSELLISNADFQRAYPEEGGYRVFLLDAPPESVAPIETALSDYGLDITGAAERRAAFHRVENTYLTTFQTLGALGLLLGTAGLAAILLRNTLERRRELGLLRAVGFNPRHLATMTLSENLFLLVCGLATGFACALIAVVPVVLQRGGSLPWPSLFALLATVLAAGVLSSWLAVRVVVRSPLLNALRSE
jgi:cell division protein FtsX